MNLNQEFKINIVDIGAKFGIHPSFRKSFDFSEFLLIDADAEEIEYLRSLYQKRNNVNFLSCFVDSQNGVTEYNLYQHPGGNSAFLPDPKSHYWTDLRPGTSNIVETRNLQTRSFDDIANERNLAIDYLKIDVEGKEVEVLQGGKSQLDKNILGVRC